VPIGKRAHSSLKAVVELNHHDPPYRRNSGLRNQEKSSEVEFARQQRGQSYFRRMWVDCASKLSRHYILPEPEHRSLAGIRKIEYSVPQAQDPDGDVSNFRGQFFLPTPLFLPTAHRLGARRFYITITTVLLRLGDMSRATGFTVYDRVGGQVVVSRYSNVFFDLCFSLPDFLSLLKTKYVW